MPRSIVQFSVCSQLVFQRKAVIAFLHRSAPGLQVLSIDLDDNLFTMTVRTGKYTVGYIEEKIAEKGFRIRLLRIIEAE